VDPSRLRASTSAPDFKISFTTRPAVPPPPQDGVPDPAAACSTVSPSSVAAATEAFPSRISACAAPQCPPRAARWSGVARRESVGSTATPCARSRRTTSVWPAEAARWRGVRPAHVLSSACRRAPRLPVAPAAAETLGGSLAVVLPAGSPPVPPPPPPPPPPAVPSSPPKSMSTTERWPRDDATLRGVSSRDVRAPASASGARSRTSIIRASPRAAHRWRAVQPSSGRGVSTLAPLARSSSTTRWRPVPTARANGVGGGAPPGPPPPPPPVKSSSVV
ncbi:unnamed protein product, partial [Ectocarpus sp. 12 AP-2014]